MPRTRATLRLILLILGSSTGCRELQKLDLSGLLEAAEAVPVFASAISSMSISDAFAILNGPDDSATTSFRQQTSAQRSERFSPSARSAMQEVGFYSTYRELAKEEARIRADPAGRRSALLRRVFGAPRSPDR